MKQRDVNKIKDIAFHGARSFPCARILEEAGYPTKKRGDKIYAECPFCGRIGKNGDKNISHSRFSVTESKNVCSCFACGEGGGPAWLYAKFQNITYIEASLILAYRMGKITEDQYSTATGSADAIRKFTNDSYVYRALDEKIAADSTPKAPDDICDLVYRHLIRMPGMSLTASSKKYLREKRYLSDKEINHAGFFSYTDYFNIDRLILSIRKEKPEFDYNDLLGVPGFFMEFTDETKTKGRWMFKHPCASCIGIPLKNAAGQIIALQMRNIAPGAVKSGMKYFYVSSRDVANEKTKGNVRGLGASSGSPVHVFYPEVKRSNTFYIGEGFFKMFEIAKEGYTALSIQGVNTFSYVPDEIREIIERDPSYQNRKLRFMIVFDMDFFEKIQVIDAGIKFYNYLLKCFPESEVFFLMWDYKIGKGYDDLKFACIRKGIDHKKVLKAISAKQVETSVFQAENILKKKYGKKADVMLRNKKTDKNDVITTEFGTLLHRYINI